MTDSHHQSNYVHSASSYKYSSCSYNEYAVSLSRKAKNHSAVEFKFTPPTQNNSKTISTEKQKKKGKSNGAIKLIVKNFEKEVTKGLFVKELRKSMKKTDVYLFIQTQRNILYKLQEEPYLIPGAKGLLSKELLATENFFTEKRKFPGSANKNLFKLLNLENQQSKEKIDFVNYYRQLQNIKSPIDRELDLQVHPSCKGFSPTLMQRKVIDLIDQGQNVILRAPTGTGKTMISLYMAQRIHNVGKSTIYIGPTKPICNEFGIFVYTQGLIPSISTEDFMNWGEIKNSIDKCGVIICTPSEFFEILIYPTIDFVSSIGSIIFDELPRLLDSNYSKTVLLLLLSQSFKWQTMAMSATMNDSIIETLNNFNSFTLVDSDNSIRPSDLILRHYCSETKVLQTIPTSSTYTKELFQLSNEEKLNIGKRVPITLSELNSITKEIGKGRLNELSNPCLSPKILKGIDLTKISLSIRENTINDHDSKSKVEKIHKDEFFSDKIIKQESKEFFEFLHVLRKENLLPVMIFHSDKELLSRYHEECSNLLMEEEEEQLKKLTPPPKIPKQSSTLDDFKFKFECEEEIEYYIQPFGKLGDEELADVFKHKYLPNGSIRFGYSGREVKNSKFYDGIQRGLGIYHHGVDKQSRVAVESGLRGHNLQVVFSDASLAFGLNLPVKSIIFLNSKAKHNKILSPEKIVQASGRAVDGLETLLRYQQEISFYII